VLNDFCCSNLFRRRNWCSHHRRDELRRAAETQLER
jgi:hypothetical protein